MKRLSFILLLCAFASVASAQKVTHTFQDITLSDALKYIQTQTADYDITFIYDELEDFRVTTHIQNKSIPDAIVQIVGFYPVRVVKSGTHEIYLECTHKTDLHLTGTVIDENSQPVPYANVYLLHPSDSTVIGGGVTGEAGVFVIPYETPTVGGGREGTVLARISYVGYKTVYRLCKQPNVGTIRLQPDNYTLNGVVVQGERPKIVLQGNSLMMNVEGTVMERMGTAEDVLTRVPMIAKRGEGYEIIGKGAPLIYLNNRKLTDLNELRNVQSDMIRSVEVIQNPGARYDASVNAVIVIRTKRAAGEGLGVELTSWSRKGHGYVNNERINLTYRTGGLELFANLFGAYNKNWRKDGFEETVYADTLWTITNQEQAVARNPFFEERMGFNYQIDDNNSFGGFYQNTYDYMKTRRENNDDLLADGVPYDHLQNSSVMRHDYYPKHQVNLYYTGKVGKLSIDFNADYTARKQQIRNQQQELSAAYEDRDVNTQSLTRSKLFAEKLFVTHPLWKGQIEIGEEYTNTRWKSSFDNKEGYIANSNNEQHESNIAPFVELRQRWGRFQLSAGLRYEHVESEYFVSGQRRDDQCRTYDDLFPSLSVSAQLPSSREGQGVGLSLSYAKRTTRPSYWQLSSDVYYENRLNMQTGNPYLKPIKYHNLNMSVMWKWLFLTTNFTHCVDPILYSAESLEEDSKVNLVSHKNYDHADWLTITLGAQKDVRLGQTTWTPQYNIMLMKPWFKSTFLDAEKRFNHPMLAMQLGNTVTLPHDWLLQADFMMHTHGYQQNAWFDCTQAMLTLSVSKDFFRRRLNVKLTGNDLFNGGSNRFTLYSNRLKISKEEDNDTRCIQLSLRYRFNVTPSKYKGTGAGNAEKNRL